MSPKRNLHNQLFKFHILHHTTDLSRNSMEIEKFAIKDWSRRAQVTKKDISQKGRPCSIVR